MGAHGVAQSDGDADPGENSDDAARKTEDNRLNQELEKDIGTSGTNCDENTDFTSSFSYGHQTNRRD